MYFDIQHSSYYSFDGRILLRVSFMFPCSVDTMPQRYLFDFVKTCQSFAQDRLYPALLQKHASNYMHENRSTYSYDVTVDEIHQTENKASYVILSILKRRGDMIASGSKTISFCEDKIIPTSYIARKRKYNELRNI